MRVRVFFIGILVTLLFGWSILQTQYGAEIRSKKPLTKGNAFIKRGSVREPHPSFKMDVNLVVVRATVLDASNRTITGLEKEWFHLFEDKVEQDIALFAQEDAPISVGILFDISASMKPHFAAAKKSIWQFLERGDEQDEFFLVTFNHKVTLDVDFTNQAAPIRNNAAMRLPGGRTAIYDAVYMGLEKIREARRERKALIIITDGEDNSSRYSFSEVKELAKECDVPIYAIIQEGTLQYGKAIIQNLVSLTGGRCFISYSLDQLEYYVRQIHNELRNQYILGYHSSNKAYDGTWRKIKVKLETPMGFSNSKMSVHARAGYYAQKR